MMRKPLTKPANVVVTATYKKSNTNIPEEFFCSGSDTVGNGITTIELGALQHYTLFKSYGVLLFFQCYWTISLN
jgi:hypothetical protein